MKQMLKDSRTGFSSFEKPCLASDTIPMDTVRRTLGEVTMKRWLGVLTGACLSVSSGALAQGDMDNHYFFGMWTVADFSSFLGSGCLMSDTARGGDGEIVIGVSSVVQTKMLISLSRPSWTVPDRLPVGARLVFPSGGTYLLTGVGDGKSMSMSMETQDIQSFFRELVSREFMHVEFNGTEKPWNILVLGADRALTAMKQCVSRRGFVAAPLPLGTAIPTPSAPQHTPTQPY